MIITTAGKPQMILSRCGRRALRCWRLKAGHWIWFRSWINLRAQASNGCCARAVRGCTTICSRPAWWTTCH